MKKGFTLIELLIVVAIIAILAAIAVPNFLEAQVRSKVSRAKADLRTVATGLESYYIDYNSYPYDGFNYSATVTGLGNNRFQYWHLPLTLSTPQAYMTTCIYHDPFRKGLQDATITPSLWQADCYRYINTESTWGTKFDPMMSAAAPARSIYWKETTAEWGGYKINSCGPDKFYGPPLTAAASSSSPYYTLIPANNWKGVGAYIQLPLPFDPTNGTVSVGDVMRSAASSTGYKNAT